MSELNYINETVVPRMTKSINDTIVPGMPNSVSETVVPGMPDGVSDTIVPRMPKSVSDEQLFVFVPTGSDFVAGIFKINTNDFDKNSLPVLKIVESESLDSSNENYNANGYVRAGIIKAYVYEAFQKDLKDEIAKKQDKNLSKTIAKATTVEGALTNIDADATALSLRVKTTEDDVAALQNTVGNKNSGLVADVETNTEAIRTINNTTIPALDKRVTANSKSITTLDGKVTGLSSGQEALKTRMTAAETELNAHATDIADLMTEEANLRKDVNTNSDNIATQGTAIEKNTNDIKALQDTAYGGETPIGTYPSASTLPTSEQLTAFVQQEVSRAPKLGDVVLFTQIVTGGTDKSYKFMYTATGWSNYVIPTVESATNTDKGILQGTLGDTTGNIQVSIAGGKVADILVKDGSTYKSIKTVLDNLATSITNTNSTVAANKTAADKGIAEAKAAAAAVVKKYNNVEFTFVSNNDNTITNFPCKYTATIDGVTIDNVADVYFSAVQIPLEIFSSYVLVEAGKVSIFATTKVNYPTSVTVPTVRIS